MSLATVLLAFLAPIVRPKSPGLQWAREKALEAERDALREELERAYRRNEMLVLERDSALRRLDEAGEMLAALAGERIDRQLSQTQQYQALAAQHNAQLAAQQAQAMQNAMLYGQGQMLGAQNLQMPEFWCNCVPARHDMLLGSIGGV